MRRLHARPIALLLVFVVLSVLVVQQAYGEDLTGTGPDFAMTPAEGWVEIQPGQYHWYVFKYDYDKDYGPMEVKLFASPAAGASLTLRNQNQAQIWRADGKHESFGACTPGPKDADKDGKADYAIWAAKLTATGEYFMVVKHEAAVSGPVQYRIEMTGKGFSFTAAPKPSENACDCPEEKVESVATPGGGPDVAMEITNEWVALNAGEYHWYYFDYTRDSKTRTADLPAIELKIYSEPQEVAHFTVRNAEEATLWRADGTQESFGCCSSSGVDKDKDGKSDYGVWKGQLPSSGRYYVVVEHTRSNATPAHYRLEKIGP